MGRCFVYVKALLRLHSGDYSPLTKMPEIHQTQWKESLNQLAEFKHIWATKKGKCFVAVATRTKVTRFLQLPMNRGTTMEFDISMTPLINDESEVVDKVMKWLGSD